MRIEAGQLPPAPSSSGLRARKALASSPSPCLTWGSAFASCYFRAWRRRNPELKRQFSVSVGSGDLAERSPGGPLRRSALAHLSRESPKPAIAPFASSTSNSGTSIDLQRAHGPKARRRGDIPARPADFRTWRVIASRSRARVGAGIGPRDGRCRSQPEPVREADPSKGL